MSEIEYCGCEACGKQVDCETTHGDWGGATFCTPCFDAIRADIAACPHDMLEPYEDDDDQGHPQSYCGQCSGVFPAQDPTP